MTTVQELYDSLERAQQNASLTLSSGSAGQPAIDDFLATMPGKSLTLTAPRLALTTGQPPAGQQPATPPAGQSTLTVSGTLNARWPLPGLSGFFLTVQNITLTYRQDTPTTPMTASLAVTAALTIGTETIVLTGSLGANSVIGFEWTPGTHGNLSLADAVTLVTDGRGAQWLPAGVPVFDSLQLGSLAVSLGYVPGVTTTVQFGLTAGADDRWEILPGKHALSGIGVTFGTAFRISEGTGVQHSAGGAVHATLDLAGGIEVTVGLTPGDVWEIELADPAGLPAIDTIAAIAGVQDEVRAGLRAIGLGDITLRSVSLGIDRATGSLAFVRILGAMSIAGKSFDVYVTMPPFALGGSLSAATPISLTALLEGTLGNAAGLPDIEVSSLALSAIPDSGYYSLSAEIDDGKLSAGGFDLTGVTLDIAKLSDGIAGAIIASITVGGSQILVTGSHGTGWTVTGQLDELSLAALITEVLAAAALPSQLSNLQITGLDASWNLSTGAVSFAGDLALALELGPQTLTSTLRLTADSAVDTQSKARTTTARLDGSVSLAGLVFALSYDIRPGQQILTGTWNAQGTASFQALAGAFGIEVPHGGVTLPDLHLTSLSFTLDWSRPGVQEVQFTAATPLGEAFFVLARPQPGQPWAFAFGAAVAGATSLSHLLRPVGLDVTTLDFIRLDGGFFLIASAPFPALQLPLAGRQVQVSQGVTAGVLADLAGGSASDPAVATLRTLLPSNSPVLFGEVSLGTSLAAIAVTIQLDGNLKIAGAGTSALTLGDVSVVMRPEPVALTLAGSAQIPLGSVTLLASGMLTVGGNGLTAVFDIQGENGGVLPFPMGFPGVHLTDLGVEVGVTTEPPSVQLGLLGRFVIGPDTPKPQGRVPSRALAAMPPPDEFVMVMGLEGELPVPLLLSMYLQELSLSKAIEAFTDIQPKDVPAILAGISANDLMIYWCGAPAGLQQPDGTWAYPGYGFNATLDIYGVHAFAELKVAPGHGISGAACVDPMGIPGVIELTGDGKGTPSAYPGQVTVRPGGAQLQVATAASPYLDVSWRLVLFGAANVSVNAQVTSSGFTFQLSGSESGFASSLACTFSLPAHLAIAFAVKLDTDIDLGSIGGVHLGHVHLADVALTGNLAAAATPSLLITIDGSFEFDGTSYTMPRISVNEPYSSLAGIPAAIERQIEKEGEALFAGFRATAAKYLNMVKHGLVIGGDEIGSVLAKGYGQTASQAAAAMKAAGYAADDAASALHAGYAATSTQAAQALKDAGYSASDVGAALTSTWHSTSDEAARDLKSARYSVSETGAYLKDACHLAGDQLTGALKGAGYADHEISSAFDSLGHDISKAGHDLNPENW